MWIRVGWGGVLANVDYNKILYYSYKIRQRGKRAGGKMLIHKMGFKRRVLFTPPLLGPFICFALILLILSL